MAWSGAEQNLHATFPKINKLLWRFTLFRVKTCKQGVMTMHPLSLPFSRPSFYYSCQNVLLVFSAWGVVVSSIHCVWGHVIHWGIWSPHSQRIYQNWKWILVHMVSIECTTRLPSSPISCIFSSSHCKDSGLNQHWREELLALSGASAGPCLMCSECLP